MFDLLVVANLTLQTPKLLALQYLHSAKDEASAQKCLDYGDKDHDGALTREEYVGLALIANDGLVRSLNQQLADERERHRRRPDPQRYYTRRNQIERHLLEVMAERKRKEARYGEEFDHYDINGDGKLDRRELAALCHVQDEEPRQL